MHCRQHIFILRTQTGVGLMTQNQITVIEDNITYLISHNLRSNPLIKTYLKFENIIKLPLYDKIEKKINKSKIINLLNNLNP